MTSARTDTRPDVGTATDSDTIGVLGPLQVVLAGREITVSGSLLRQLLLRLAVDAPRPVSATALTEAVWGLDPPDDPVNALQSLVSRLRRVLGATPGNGGSAVAGGPAGYQLRLPGLVVDADRFTALADLGRHQLRAGEVHVAAGTLRAALGLWRGDALADAGEADWARPTRRALAARRDDALLDRIDADAARGLHASLTGELAALDLEHPLDERFAGRHVDALAADGRSAAALAAYEQFRGRLADALGSDPSPALQARHLALLRAATASADDDPAEPRTPVRAVAAGVLPLPITTFVGRAADLAAVRELLAAGRLVTVVGAGGCGKTRLATEVARHADPGTRREVRFVQLAPVTAGNEVAAVVLSALGMTENRGADRSGTRRPLDPTQRILAAVGDTELLLLLDNCEHLLAAVAELAERLLSTCPGVRILTTSREPLALTGEALWPLAPLGVPPAAGRGRDHHGQPVDPGAAGAAEFDAVRLFGDRARAARPAFVLDDTTVGDVTEIVRRLDGLPLAIELAAARLRTLPLAQITDGLSDRFRLLTGGSRTALPRHRTLRAVVEWSWELLTDDERRVAEAVSVFPAGVTAASAHAACVAVRGGDGRGHDGLGDHGGSGADVVADILASLVDKSLLTLDGAQPRYRMLETLREFGIERLAARGELGAAYDAHARFFAALAARAEPELRTAGQLPWIRTLVAERENLAAAVRQLAADSDAAAAISMAARLTLFWIMADWHTDSHEAVSTALDAADRLTGDSGGSIPDPVELVCLRGLRIINEAALGTPGAAVDQPTLQRELTGVADALSALVPDIEALPEWPRCLALVAAPIFDLFAAHADRAERVDRVLADPVPWVAAIGHVMAAALAENDGDVPTLRIHADLGLAAMRPIGERWGLAAALRLVGQVRVYDGDLPGAAAAYTEALAHSAALATEFGTPGDDVFVRLQLARVLLRLGDVDGAVAQARQANTGAAPDQPDLGAIVSDALLLQILGSAGRSADELDEIRARIATRLAERPRGGGPFAGHETALALSVAASLDIESNLLDRARTQLADAVEAAVGTADQPLIAAIGLTVARLALAHGDAPSAARLIGAATALRGSPDRTDPDLDTLFRALRQTLGDGEVDRLTVFAGDRPAAVELLRAAVRPGG